MGVNMKYCWNCDEQVEITTEMADMEYIVKGTLVKATIPIKKCNECGDEMYDFQNELEVDKIILEEARKLGVEI